MGKNKNKTLITTLTSIVDYHNNLVQSRFTIAGLLLTANGFLAVGYFQNETNKAQIMIPILGVIFSIICWILERRTKILLDNLGERGKKIEHILKIDSDVGFFELMREQLIGPKFRILKRIFTHSFGLRFLYIVLGCFWIFSLYSNELTLMYRNIINLLTGM